MGDLDGDGVNDLAAGADGDDHGGSSRGAVHILFMDDDGTVDHKKKIMDHTGGPTLSARQHFGDSAADMGDIDGDGIHDLAVGAPKDSTGGSNRGAVHVLFMDSDGSVSGETKIAHDTGGGPSLGNSSHFGVSVAGIGDLNRDGVPDMAVGADGDSAAGHSSGAVYILFMNSDGTASSTVKITHNTNGGPSLSGYDYFGSSVDAIGDLDGDGIQDLAVGATGDGHNSTGAVWILFMNADGTASSMATIDGDAGGGPTLHYNDRFGSSVAGIGDLDGDGIPDIAVGATNYNTGGGSGGDHRGNVYILFMNADGTASSVKRIANNVSGGPPLDENDKFGDALANMGDLDGDGIQDLAVGAVGDDTGRQNAGAVYLLFMNTDGTVDSYEKIARNTNGGPSLRADSYFGSGVASIGDLNRDGVQDMLAGAYYADTSHGTQSGTAFVMLLDTTSKTILDDPFVTAHQKTTATTANENFGSSVAAIGDLDRDGVPDLAAGAKGHDSNRGAAYILFMDDDGTVDSSQQIALNTGGGPPLSQGDRFGESMAAIGDLDRDGVPDLAVGAYQDDTGGADGNRGAVWILFMNADGTVDSKRKIANNTNGGPWLDAWDQFGSSVAAMGDIDGDGIQDIAVGAIGDDAASADDRGAVYVLFMDANGQADSRTKIAHTVNGGPTLAAGDRFGHSAAGIGDLDGDGISELAVGAYQDDTGGNNRGAVHILFMDENGKADSRKKIANNTNGGPPLSNGDLFGSSVAGIGDIDHDGVPDIVVGAMDSDLGGTDFGALYVLLMNNDGTAKSSIAIGQGQNGVSGRANDDFGAAVAAADIDGDMVADIVAGAPHHTTIYNDDGAIYVLFTAHPLLDAPPAAADDAATTPEDTAVTISVLDNDTDPDGDTLTTHGYQSWPAHGEIVINSNNTITYMPDADYYGTDSFIYVASDGHLTDSATVTVTINGTADAPVAANDTAKTPAGAAVTISVLSNDTDPDGDSLTVSSISSQPSNGTAAINSGSTTITYTPDSGYSGADSFSYTASDGSLTDTATVTVTMHTGDDAPVADAGSDQTVTQGATVTLDGSGSSDPDDDTISYSWSRTAGPAVTLSSSTAKKPTFTAPTVSSNTAITFQLTVSDGLFSDTDSVTITVKPPPADAAAGCSQRQPVHPCTGPDRHDKRALKRL